MTLLKIMAARCALFLIGLGLAVGGGVQSPPIERPNVLFISIDDMRLELGAYGAPHVQTPHMDRLAAEGVILLQAHCQYPQCAPSRSSVFTGRRPDTTKVFDVFTHFRPALPDVLTLPQLFKQQGYQARSLGKVYHTNLDDPASWSVPHWEPDMHPLHYANPETRARLQRRREETAAMPGLTPRQRAQAAYGPAYEAQDGPDSDHHDGQVTDQAVAALREYAQNGTGFFLAVGYRKPHLPFVAPKKYWDRYDPDAIPLADNDRVPAGAPPYGPVDGGEFRAYENMPVYPTRLSDHEARRLRHGYYACVTFVDEQVGRLLAEMEELGLSDNTLVVLWSDHGYHLGELAHWGKWSPYEWDTRSPLIFKGPRVPAGVATNALVEFVDIYPTVAALAGLPVAEDELEGVSMEPLFHAPDRPWKTAVFTQVLRLLPEGSLMATSMRTATHRLTRWTAADNPADQRYLELYDLTADSVERRNVVDEPAYSGVAAELMTRLSEGWPGALPAP